MISVVNQSMFGDGQAVLIRECEFTAAQLDDIINHSGIEKFKEDNDEEVALSTMEDDGSSALIDEPVNALEEFATTHLQNKTNLNGSTAKPLGKPRADGSENKYINLVVLRKKKKTIEKKNVAVVNLKKDGKPVPGNTVALCNMCGKHFSSNYNLKRHMACCKLCPEEEKGPRFQCQCGRTYSQEWDMKKHKISCQDSSKNCKSCLFPFCNLLFYHRSQLLAHMKNAHNVCIRDPEVLDFESIDDFKLWKERIEEETYTYYSKQTGSNVTGVSVNTYYVCQHDGSDRAHTSAPRKTERRNKKGRVKTGRFCWSQMNVKEFRDGAIRVTFYPSHTHPISATDTEHHPLPSSITSEIQRRLTEIQQEDENPLTAEYPEFKKSRKKSFAMNVRTLRALARKNRKLFRITAEAIDGADDAKGTEDSIAESKPEEDGSVLLIPAEEVSPLEEATAQLSHEDVIESCSSYWDQLRALMGSGKLGESLLSQVQNALAGLVDSCREELMQGDRDSKPVASLTDLTEVLYQAQGPSPGSPVSPAGFSLTDDQQGSLQLQHDDKTIYQVVTLAPKEEPMSPAPDEMLYHNAVELVGPREFIIIANDHAQIFHSVSSSQHSLGSTSTASQLWANKR